MLQADQTDPSDRIPVMQLRAEARGKMLPHDLRIYAEVRKDTSADEALDRR